VRLVSSVAPSILTLSETGVTVPASLTDLRPDRNVMYLCAQRCPVNTIPRLIITVAITALKSSLIKPYLC